MLFHVKLWSNWVSGKTNIFISMQRLNLSIWVNNPRYNSLYELNTLIQVLLNIPVVVDA